MWSEESVLQLIKEGQASENKKEQELADYLQYVYNSFKYYENAYLEARSKKGEGVENPTKERRKAHEAWLEEKHEVLHLLESIKEDIINLNGGDNTHPAIDDLDYVIDFIEKGGE